jgi:hypothetical protein
MASPALTLIIAGPALRLVAARPLIADSLLERLAWEQGDLFFEEADERVSSRHFPGSGCPIRLQQIPAGFRTARSYAKGRYDQH